MIEKCLKCGTPVRGRLDKKFCTDYCRSAWHNMRNRSRNRQIRRVNRILKNNRIILESLFSRSRGEPLARSHLMDQGFDFRYFTHLSADVEGDEVRFCYDYGYSESPLHKVAVVKGPQEIH